MRVLLYTMLQKFTSPFKEFGIFGGCLYLIDRTFSRTTPGLRLFYYEFLVQPIPDKPLIPARLSKQMEIREIKHGDPEIELMPAPPEIKESRFAQNAICLGAFRNEKFIGYIWFNFSSYEEDEVRCTFILTPEEEATFDFDLYIFPKYRMGLGFIGIWNGANEYLRRRGVKFSFSRLNRFNIASRKAHQHLGCKCVGRAVFLKAGPLELMLGSIFPYLNLSLRRASRVRLKLCPDALSS